MILGPENPIQVIEGLPVNLVCDVDAKPAVSSVQWTFQGRILPTSSFTHTIMNAQRHNAGTYSCSADNGLGQRGQATVRVDVLYPPTVILLPRKEVNQNTDVNIQCETSSNPPPTIIEWTKKGDPSFRLTGGVLSISSVTATDSGEYVCHAKILSNDLTSRGIELEGTASTNLVVRHAPGKTVITSNRDVAVDGASVTLSCTSDPPGYPTPKYRWWSHSSRQIISSSQNFTIPIARITSEGEYYCEPSNELGAGSQGFYSLEVHVPPKIITLLPTTVVKDEGQSGFSIVCSAEGKPKPLMKWLHNGQEINTHDFAVDFAETEKEKGTFVVESSLKIISTLTAEHRGVFSCIFSNTVGEAVTEMMLHIKRK